MSRLSLAVASGDYSPVAVCDLLLWRAGSRRAGFSSWTRELSSCSSQALEHGSVAVVLGLSCSATCGIFLDQGLNRSPLHCKGDS